ncbi:hypothetical protein [Paenibacillus maysiensis]|uniref:hypothetical protein n=1 Tax=Paenibacillus maysiensis TaxID=1155954 RepID=UPI00046E6F46|nr:hypothetical protein [Paenibacillus maysiensis]
MTDIILQIKFRSLPVRSKFKLPSILNSISPYIETNLSTTEILQLASLGFNIDVKTIAKQQIPPNELVRETTDTP